MVAQFWTFCRVTPLRRYSITTVNTKIREEFTETSKELLHLASSEPATPLLVQSLDLHLNPFSAFYKEHIRTDAISWEPNPTMTPRPSHPIFLWKWMVFFKLRLLVSTCWLYKELSLSFIPCVPERWDWGLGYTLKAQRSPYRDMCVEIIACFG